MNSDKMTPQVQALVISNLKNTIASLQAKAIVNAKQLAAVKAELSDAESGKW